ncbi:MAG: glycosyltransferase, partial [Saprospiraceae bacterium]|nr:glycosyltransferase [Saprospiraceae bacterium]
VPVEAQACGIPVIVYQSPINAETLPEGSAWRVPMGDANGMADAIHLLWNQPQVMAALRDKGLENAQRFSCSIFRERLHAIYTQLLENKTG